MNKRYWNNKKIIKWLLSKKHGSYTIEASFLIPLLIMVTVFFIYLSFYVYNRCILSQNASISALRGSLLGETNEKIYKEVMETNKELAYHSVFAADTLVYGSEISIYKIISRYEMKMKIPMEKIYQIVGAENRWDIKIEKSAVKINTVMFIRGCRKIENSKSIKQIQEESKEGE